AGYAVLLSRLRQAWRRSLQFRMVTITVVMTGVLMLGFGLVVGSLLINNLVTTQTDVARSTVDNSTSEALGLLESQVSGTGDSLFLVNLHGVALQLNRRISVPVAFLPAPESGVAPGEAGSGLSEPSVPD